MQTPSRHAGAAPQADAQPSAAHSDHRNPGRRSRRIGWSLVSLLTGLTGLQAWAGSILVPGANLVSVALILISLVGRLAGVGRPERARGFWSSDCPRGARRRDRLLRRRGVDDSTRLRDRRRRVRSVLSEPRIARPQSLHAFDGAEPRAIPCSADLSHLPSERHRGRHVVVPGRLVPLLPAGFGAWFPYAGRERHRPRVLGVLRPVDLAHVAGAIVVGVGTHRQCRRVPVLHDRRLDRRALRTVRVAGRLSLGSLRRPARTFGCPVDRTHRSWYCGERQADAVVPRAVSVGRAVAGESRHGPRRRTGRVALCRNGRRHIRAHQRTVHRSRSDGVGARDISAAVPIDNS